MPDAIGQIYCTVHQVYILPEDSGTRSTLLSPDSEVLLASVSELTKWCACVDITRYAIKY